MLKFPQKLNKDTIKNFFEKIEIKSEDKLKRDIQTLKGSKISLAEDNETNQEIIMGLLESSGIKISIASNGQEAVDKFNEIGGYELILMDLQMPIMDGFEATKLIKQKDKNIPIVAMTAHALKEEKSKSLKAGMNDYLTKPIDLDNMFQTLSKFVELTSVTVKEDGVIDIGISSLDPSVLHSHFFGDLDLYIDTLNDVRSDYKNIDKALLTMATTGEITDLQMEFRDLMLILKFIGAKGLAEFASELYLSLLDDELPFVKVEAFVSSLQQFLNELHQYFTTSNKRRES